MTPMRDQLTYNNDDTGNMSPLASSSYSPPFYLHTSGIDCSDRIATRTRIQRRRRQKTKE